MSTEVKSFGFILVLWFKIAPSKTILFFLSLASLLIVADYS